MTDRYRKPCTKCERPVGKRNITGLCAQCHRDFVNERAAARTPTNKPCTKCETMTTGGGKTGLCLPCSRRMHGRYSRRPPVLGGLFTLSQAVNAVAQCSGISTWRLLGPDRLKEVCRARHVVFFIARQAGHNFVRIGKHFDRDHSTVAHGYDVVARNMATDGELAELMRDSRAVALAMAEAARQHAGQVVQRALSRLAA